MKYLIHSIAEPAKAAGKPRQGKCSLDHFSLKLFLHLAESLHFGKTSAACYLSPSALSRQIKRLEEEVGHRLFERDKRTVELTRAGGIFRDYAKEALDKWRITSNLLNEESDIVQGELSLYCSVTASYSILPPVLGKYRESYPDVHLKLQTGDAASSIQKIVEDDFDLTVIALPDNLPEGLLFKEIAETPIIFIAPGGDRKFRALLEKVPVPWRDIPIILAEKGIARKSFDQWFRAMGVAPNIYADVSGNEAILSMVNLGCGIGLVPELVALKSPFKDDLTVLDIKHPIKPYKVGICVKQNKLRYPPVRAFWDII